MGNSPPYLGGLERISAFCAINLSSRLWVPINQEGHEDQEHSDHNAELQQN
jgi:hypothetical protein